MEAPCARLLSEKEKELRMSDPALSNRRERRSRRTPKPSELKAWEAVRARKAPITTTVSLGLILLWSGEYSGTYLGSVLSHSRTGPPFRCAFRPPIAPYLCAKRLSKDEKVTETDFIVLVQIEFGVKARFTALVAKLSGKFEKVSEVDFAIA